MGALRRLTPRARMITIALVVVGLAGSAAAQRGRRGGGFNVRLPENPPYDGAFRFCRIMFRQNPNGDGGGWSVDYPRADINLTYRLSELTATTVSKDAKGTYKHVVLRLTDDELYKCPFIMMTEVGAAYLNTEEAARLRDYLLKGGFLWADDFWGEYAWTVWQSQIAKALPEYQIVDIPLAHSLFHMLYQVDSVPQIPSINAWFSLGGGTSERGADSAVPHARGSSTSTATSWCSSRTTPTSATPSSGKATAAPTSSDSPAWATRSASTRSSTRCPTNHLVIWSFGYLVNWTVNNQVNNQITRQRDDQMSTGSSGSRTSVSTPTEDRPRDRLWGSAPSG